MKRLVSIIVPVHNSGKYLKKCITSILNQTYENIEIICIENGSSDDSLSILKSFKDKIKLEILEEAGLSRARNRGLDLASGDYIAFVDSDDYIESTMIEQLVECLEKESSDMSISNYREVIEGGATLEKVAYPNGSIESEEIKNNLVEFNYAIWNKLFKSELILKYNIRFPLDLKYEDIPFVLVYLYHSNKISKTDGYLYNYMIHSKSEQTTVDKRIFDIFGILDICKSTIESKYLQSVFARELLTYSLKMKFVQDKKFRKEFIDRAYQYLDEYSPGWKTCGYIKSLSFIKGTIVKRKNLLKLYVSVFKG